ncbi:MAG: hypothetical protein O3C40_11270 [Planctomycetota bacterium]|nr:hypothetical protein [Planctomycetota bacterium]
MWQLDGSKARLQSPQLGFQLDLASPSSGLTALKVALDSSRALNSIDAALMQLALPGKETLLADAYVRGTDLVATFSESADHPCRTQVYWRSASEADYFGIQLIVSVQTSQLDAAPSLMVASRLPGSARLIEEGIVIVPLLESDVCYAELTDGSNIESTIVSGTQITNKLFPGSLEKGVIRRARILGCFLAASSAEHTARTIHRRFARAAPPLTT